MKKLPIGIDNYKKIIDNDLRFVDKTLFIKNIIDDSSEVILITRPRRFGKTLSMSMLKYFYEKTKEDNSYLFKDMKIWKEDKKYKEELGKYPVINLTLKNVKFYDWETNYETIKNIITSEFLRHDYLLDSNVLKKGNKKRFEDICYGNGDRATYSSSLELLSKVLYEYHKEKVLILLDEYDTLLNESYVSGFYNEAREFMRGFLNSGFKNNPYLHKGIITGIFRIAKESIFSDINNLNVSTILSNGYRESMGFTLEETESLLKEYKVKDNIKEVTNWYNGYIFGETEFSLIYNPFSIMLYLDRKILKPYWVNTSGNAIIKDIVINGSRDIKEEIKKLLKGDEIKGI
ncbi:MAG: AAA family ATPase, partial [Clostridiales bacterium]